MTKEEYRKLLESDYWKGFSYSIIKERNFTCEDCGKRFPGERNMLQVHHLVYRDIMPWSYNPDEMVVLCRTCHAKRHGLIQDSPKQKSHQQTVSNKEEGQYVKTYCKPYFGENDAPIPQRKIWTESRILFIIMALAALFAVSCFVIEYQNTKQRANDLDQTPEESFAPVVEAAATEFIEPTPRKSTHKSSDSSKKEKNPKKNAVRNVSAVEPVAKKSNQQSSAKIAREQKIEEPTATLQNSIVSTPLNKEVNRKESVEDIQERLNRKYWEDRARQEGVSAEGSVNDIQERLNRKYWEDRARQEGVSAEGSVNDIQERLNRKYWEDRARQEGVSTKGSVNEIQERLNRKYWENRAKEEGI